MKIRKFNGSSWVQEYPEVRHTDIVTTGTNNSSTYLAGDGSWKAPLYYVVGNTSGTAGTWTGTIPGLTAYYDGLTIRYKQGIAGATNVYLNINSLGAAQVYRYAGARLTTHWPSGTISTLTYNSSDNRWYANGDYNSTDDYRIRWQNDVAIGAYIHGYQLLAEGTDGAFYPVTEGGSTGNTNTVSTADLRIGGTLLAYESGTDIAAGGTSSGYEVYEGINSAAMEYWNNRDSGWATDMGPIYLVGIDNGDGSYNLDNTSYTSFLTQTIPTSDDGKIYIHIGWMNNTNDNWRLEVVNQPYVYKDGAFQLYSGYATYTENADKVDGVHATSFLRNDLTSTQTVNSDINIGPNTIDFNANSGNSTTAQIIGDRSSTDLDTRNFTTEGGLSYTTFDGSTSNKPGGSFNNANGLITMNTHSGAYNWQLAFANNQGGIFNRYRNGGSYTSWERMFDDGYHPNADAWTTARTITLGGDLSGSVSLDGSANVTLSAQVSNNSHEHRNLDSVDDRDIAPEDLSYSDDFRIFFAEKSQVEGGVNASIYLDLLTLNSYSDSTGGDTNALGFLKSSKRIYHYQADQSATNWGSPETIAYVSDIPTNNNELTNGAGYITSADGGNADTLDGINSTQFLRSDQNDTMTGDLTLSNSNPVLILNDTGTTTGNAYIDYQAGLALKVHAGADPITFIAGNSEKARITAGNGNLGLGTTNPSARLEVIGDIKIKQGSGYSNYGLIDQTEALMEIDTYSVNTSSYPADIVFRPNLTERMRITDDGKLGIGTSSPLTKMHIVEGSTSTALTVQNASSNGTVMKLATTGDGRNLYLQSDHIYSNGNLYFGDNSYETIIRGSDVKIENEILHTKTSYGEPNTENFYRIKLQDQGGVHNDVGIGQTASGNMGYNVTAANAHIFYEGTNGEIARLQPSGLALNHSGTGTVESKSITFTSQTSGTDVVRVLKTTSGGNLDFNAGAVSLNGNGNITAKGHLFLNNDNTAADSYVYFGDSGSDTAHYLRLSHSGQRFQISNTLDVGGALTVDSNLYLNYDNSPAGTDPSIYFGDDSSDSAHYIQFDNSEQKFNFSNDILVNGSAIGGGGVTSIKNFAGPYVNTNGFTAKQLPLSKTLSTGDRIGLSVIVGTTTNYGTRTQQTVWLEVGTSSHAVLFAYYDNSTSTMRLYSAEVYISSGNLYIDDAVAWTDGAFGHSGSSTSAIYVMDVLEYA